MPVATVDKLCYPLITESPFDTDVSLKHFEIVYHAGKHYSSIVCSDTGVPCTSPPPLIEEVMLSNNE